MSNGHDIMVLSSDAVSLEKYGDRIMKELNGSEKQISWANDIRTTVLTYAQEQIARQQEMAARYSDPEDVEAINYRIEQIAEKIEKINNITEARILIDYLSKFSKMTTKEEFAAKNPNYTAEQIDNMFEMSRAQMSGTCVETLLKCKSI